MPIWNAEQVAIELGVSPKTLANWRSSGTGPSYFKLGKTIRYDSDDVWDWLEAHKQEHETKQTPTV
jgi:predicted DNA-binding transcriptional regulator AlpA